MTAYTRAMTKVVVLSGGTNAESEVSLRSGKAVTQALKTAGYDVTNLDPADRSPDELLDELTGVDVVFPVLHGKGGEDGTLQTWLESHNVCFVGSNAETSRVCFDKWQFKEMIGETDISMPPAELVTRETIWDSSLTTQPYVLKPLDEGSSVDTFIIRHPEKADKQAIEAVFEKHHMMLLEELIEGIEITVGILGNEALPVIEIIPPSGGEFDYTNKYNGQTQELCPPEHIDADTQSRAQKVAERIHQTLGVVDISRTDMIVRRSDKEIFVLEINTLPGLTDQSLIPKAAAVAGYDMPAFTKNLVEAALARKPKA